MTKHQFGSEAEFIQAVAESKQAYDAARSTQPFEDKLKILVKLQEKAYFMGMTKIKPWPIR